MRRHSPLWSGDPRVKPPYGSVAVDWAHPLARGLELCSLLNEGAGPIGDLTQRHAPPVMTNTAWAPSPYGLSLDFNGTNAQVEYPAFTPTPVLPITFALRVFSHDINGPRGLFDSGPSTANTLRNWDKDNIGWHGGPDLDINLAQNVWTDLVVAYSFTTVRTLSVYKDATLVSTVTGSTDPTISWTTLRLGSINNGGAGWFDGEFGHVLIWSGRLVTASDVAQLAAEPYGLVRPILRRRYFVPTGAPPFQSAWAHGSNVVLVGAGRVN